MAIATYAQYKTEMQKIADIRYAGAVLQWDQETYMPPKGGEIRGRQVATLAELAHEKFTSKEMGHLLRTLSGQPGLPDTEARNVHLSLEDYEKTCKLPGAFVRQMSETINRSFHAWINARKNNNFQVFEPALQEVINLKRQEAEYLGYKAHPYDALLNDYDKGQTVEKLDKIFGALRPRITAILDQVKEHKQVDDDLLHQHFEKDKQWELGLEVLKLIGYDFEAGRQDISEHPFTTNFSSEDVRVTTRVDETDFASMLWSCIHEGGHALYEQGLPASQYGLPLGEYCSISIHESQSRLWENCIGRSPGFWEVHFDLVKKYFPLQFEQVTPRQFYRAINKVQPSFIRTEADELTYHFHVMIRYELEKLLIDGSLSAKDIPAYWNTHYEKYLGVIVPDDLHGCLQDIHWSHGSFGYFSTYSIGSLYAAQFDAAIKRQNASLNETPGSPDLENVSTWLRQHIYPFGRYYNSEDLCQQATGETLNPDYFVTYADKKYKQIYAEQ